MKTFQLETEIAPDAVLILHELPFAPGERVAVAVSSPSAFSEMRSYAERLGAASGEFVKETDDHVTERLLRETAW
jgi:hypothetical protein